MSLTEYIKENELSKDPKFEKVMKEFKDGKLKTKDGKKVVDRKQAIAIAFSESKRKKELDEDGEAATNAPAINTQSIGGANAQYASKWGETFKRVDDKLKMKKYNECQTYLDKIDFILEVK